MQIFNQTNFDFVRWRWHAIALSLIVILAGAATIWTRGLSLGVDFAGGSIVIVKFEQATPVDRVRAAINGMPNGVGNDAVVQDYGEPSQHMVLVRVAQTAAQSSGNLSADADAVVAALKQANVGTFEVVGTEIVGPVVGQQLKKQGILATVFALDRDPGLHRLALPGQLRRRRRRRDAARPARLRWRSWRSSATT